MKELGELKDFLGIEIIIVCDKKTLSVSKSINIHKRFEIFGMSNGNPQENLSEAQISKSKPYHAKLKREPQE